jgi:hypothetical protein
MGKSGARVVGWLIVGTLLLPASAQASTVIATATSIQGAGQISGNQTNGGWACLNQKLTNESVTSCGVHSENAGSGHTAQMTITATPRPTGGWVFDHWEGCPSGALNPCTAVALGLGQPFPFDTTVLFQPRAVFADHLPPIVSGLTHTFQRGNSQVRFNWGVDDSATFRCKIDSGAFAACSDGKTYTLPEGNRTLTLRATDLAGNVALDLTDTLRMLDTQLVSGPKTFERVRAASFRIRSLVGVEFECRLTKPGQAAPAFAGCGPKGPDGTLTIPYNAAALAQNGAYTFEARSKDGADFDRTALSRTWTVDTVAPNTGLSSPDLPEGVVTTLLDAKFSFASSEALGALQCSLDGAPFAACSSPRTLPDLAFGAHTFQVRAIDRAGNVDATPAVRHWTVAAKDDDGDGFNQRSDCDDDNPRVHPNARDIPGNRKDEDCDGKDAQRQRVGGSVATGWSVLGSALTVTKLDAIGVVKRTKIQLRCLGSGCTFKRIKVKGKPRRGKLNLLKSLDAGQRVFRAGQTLEVRLTARKRNGTVLRYKLKSGKLPVGQSLCLPPGAKKPKRRC